MLVYRVENQDGRGPYRGDSDFQSALSLRAGMEHDMVAVHRREGLGTDYGAATRWGFESMRSLREWFDYFGEFGYDYLRTRGFAIVVYQVPEDRVSKYTRQVTFDLSAAESVGSEEL